MHVLDHQARLSFARERTESLREAMRAARRRRAENGGAGRQTPRTAPPLRTARLRPDRSRA